MPFCAQCEYACFPLLFENAFQSKTQNQHTSLVAEARGRCGARLRNEWHNFGGDLLDEELEAGREGLAEHSRAEGVQRGVQRGVERLAGGLGGESVGGGVEVEARGLEEQLQEEGGRVGEEVLERAAVLGEGEEVEPFGEEVLVEECRGLRWVIAVKRKKID